MFKYFKIYHFCALAITYTQFTFSIFIFHWELHNKWTEYVCYNLEISALQLVRFPQLVVWHAPHSALTLSKYNPWAISVARLPGPVHDKCLALEECFPCHLLLTLVWVAGSEVWARSQNYRTAAFIMPDLWMCHIV